MIDEKTGSKGILEAQWKEAEKERTPRLRYLRQAVWPKYALGGYYMTNVGICTEKPRWFTKVFMETETPPRPWKIRRAQAFAAYLQNVPIYIVDNAQLVGHEASRPNLFIMHMENSYIMNDDLIYDKVNHWLDVDKSEVKKYLDYWNERTWEAAADPYFSQEELMASKMSMALTGSPWLEGYSSANIPYHLLLKEGLKARMDRIDTMIEEAEETLSSGPADPGKMDLMDKLDQWKAMSIAGRAVLHWAKRYSMLANLIAENFETDVTRKAELQKISAILEKVPAYPAETFHEALQCQHFCAVAAKVIERGHTGWAIRPDTLFWPYYEKDIKVNRTLKREDALELLCEWRLRLFELGKLGGRVAREGQQGMTDPRVLTIGGQNPDGSDACNELTELICDATRIIRTAFPSVAFSYHPKVSLSAMKAAFECLRQGNGMPSFENNTTHVEQLMGNFGVPLGEARTWANVVCKSPGVTTDRGQGVKYAQPYVASCKALEYAIHNGKEPCAMNLQLGPTTGDPEELNTWDSFTGAVREQMNYMIDMACRMRNKARWTESKYMSQPFLSCLYDRCIDGGYDATEPNELPNPWLTVWAVTDLGDSMAAVKRLVYDQRKYTLKELADALQANWIGYDDMRNDFVNVPKWGNDVEETDAIFVLATEILADAFARNVELSGGRWMALPNTNASQPLVTRISALPTGRRVGEPYSDGGASPLFGMDKKGPTAVLRSMSKLNAAAFKGILLNQRFSPVQMAGEKGFQLWLNYIKTWHDLGVDHVQFNMVDNETLRSAQKEPEKYSDLIVRVAGWSAHFVDQTRLVQDSIIVRTVQEM